MSPGCRELTWGLLTCTAGQPLRLSGDDYVPWFWASRAAGAVLHEVRKPACLSSPISTWSWTRRAGRSVGGPGVDALRGFCRHPLPWGRPGVCLEGGGHGGSASGPGSATDWRPSFPAWTKRVLSVRRAIDRNPPASPWRPPVLCSSERGDSEQEPQRLCPVGPLPTGQLPSGRRPGPPWVCIRAPCVWPSPCQRELGGGGQSVQRVAPGAPVGRCRVWPRLPLGPGLVPATRRSWGRARWHPQPLPRPETLGELVFSNLGFC